MVSKPEVFVRSKSGLVRVMSAHDALLFNLVCMQFCGGVIFTLQMAPYFFPQANIPLTFVLTIIATLPLYLIYSVLATSYPRSGGDYVFISRLVSPLWGFIGTFAAWVFWQFWWQSTTAVQIQWEAVSPLFAKLSFYTGSSSLSGISSWLLTPSGIIVTGLIVIVVSLVVAALGLSFYVKIQKFLFAFAIVAVALIFITLATTSPQSFAISFNNFVSRSTGQEANWYEEIITQAKAAGYSHQPVGFDWYQTLGALVLTMMPLGYGFWSIIVMGEIKEAKVLRLATYSIYGSVAIMGLFYAALYMALQQVGAEFYNSFFYLYMNGGSTLISQLPFTPNFVTLVLIASNNWLVDLLISIGVMFNLFNLMIMMYIVGSRVMFAQTLDRILPDKLANLNLRYIAPINALIVYGIFSAIFLVLQALYPAIFFYTTAAVAGVLLAYILAGVAAIVFPYRGKKVYSTCLISKYSVARIPLIVVLGILSLLFSGLLIYFYVAIPSLGMVNPIPFALVIIVYVVLAVQYYVNKWYKKRNGIEIDLAFKEIPPE